MSVNVELDDTNKHVVINAEWRFKELCKSLPGAKWDTKLSVWTVPLSWATCLALRSTFRNDLIIGPKLTDWATNELANRITPANTLRDLETLEDLSNADLFPHQRAGVAFLKTARRALLADEPGLGKTAQAIRALKAFKDSGEDIFPALVVCPNTLKKNWKREFIKWWPDVNVQVIKGSAGQRRKQFEEPADVYVINWEGLRTHSRLAGYGSIALARCQSCGGHDEKVSENRCEVHARELNNIDFKAVIADECFIGSTLVSTPEGDKRIDELQVGDSVWGFDHVNNVVVSSKILSTMNRKSVTIVPKWGATPNHPFYVHNEGYRAVGDLTEEDVVYAIGRDNMQEMQPTVYRTRFADWGTNKTILQQDVLGEREREKGLLEDSFSKNVTTNEGLLELQNTISAKVWKNKGDFLQQTLRTVVEIQPTWNTRKTITEYVKAFARSRQSTSTENARTSSLGKKSISSNRSHYPFSEWEARMAASSIWDEYQSQKNVSGGIDAFTETSRTSDRVYGSIRLSRKYWNEVRILGHRVSRNKISGRGRWRSAYASGTQGCRCNPNRETHDVRVDGHPLLELRDPQRYEQVCRDSAREDQTTVYSLTTSTGNYFANGVLVRNCHRSKEPKSKQTRALWAATGDADIRFALTGTPISNNVLDIWTILHWLSPEEWPSKTRWVDRMINTMLNAFGGMMVLGVKPHMEQEFYAAINPRMRRMLKAKVLPWLPEMMFERRDVEMSTKQKKAYDQMRDMMIAELEGGEALTAPSALTQTIRLLQFASSYAEMATNETTGEIKAVLADPSCKVEALMDDIKNGDFGNDSVAVCAVSRQLIYLLSAALTKEDIRHGLITGAQSEDERQQAVDDFQAGKIKWILFTAQAGGVGITLTAARRLIMLQRPWSLVDHKQALDRVHRIGSEIHDSIIVTDYVTEGTIEERVIQVLETKADNFEQIVRDKDKLLSLLKDDKAGKL